MTFVFVVVVFSPPTFLWQHNYQTSIFSPSLLSKLAPLNAYWKFLIYLYSVQLNFLYFSPATDWNAVANSNKWSSLKTAISCSYLQYPCLKNMQWFLDPAFIKIRFYISVFHICVLCPDFSGIQTELSLQLQRPVYLKQFLS